ncbi:hypothetical protein QZH41_020753, partial [Actinostola sp. cb2023]
EMDPVAARDLLKKLKDLPITLECLQKTRIGMSVNTLRKKSDNADVQTMAKSLIKSWKRLLPGSRAFVIIVGGKYTIFHFTVISAEQVASRCENCIFEEFKDTNVKYKQRIRSRVNNLRDPKNPMLKVRLLGGEIPPERFANMSSEDMATDELKMMRQEFTKEGIKEAQLAKNLGTSTSLFKCGKCGLRKTTYNQLQTRSADEPMTTFVYCTNCGNRWKV